MNRMQPPTDHQTVVFLDLVEQRSIASVARARGMSKRAVQNALTRFLSHARAIPPLVPAPIGDRRDLEALLRVETETAPGALSECWLVIGHKTSDGYVTFQDSAGRRQSAHRVALERVLGRDIMPGYVAAHMCHDTAASLGQCAGGPVCHHRRCINPTHLSEMTPTQNTLASPLTLPGQAMRRATCPRGHGRDQFRNQRCHACRLAYGRNRAGAGRSAA